MGSFSSTMVVEWWVDNSARSLSVAAVAGLLLAVLRIRDANIQHRTWTVVLAATMVLPALSPMLPVIESPLRLSAIDSAETEVAPVEQRTAFVAPPLAGRHETESAPSPVVEQPTAPTRVEKPASVPMPRDPISWAAVAVAVYVAIAVVLLARILIGIVLTRRMVRRGRPLTSDDHTAFAGVAPIIESRAIQTPATVGIWHPMILLPSDWRTWSTETLQMAIAHESFHVRRRDALLALVANVNVALYWLNPLAWFLRWRLAGLAERVCDDEVLRVHGDHAGYAETLLAVASRLTNGERVSPLVVPMARKAQVETRIEAIIDDNRPLCRRLGWRGAVVMLLIALPLIVVAAAVQQAETAELGDERPEFSQVNGNDQRKATRDFKKLAEAKGPEDTTESWPDETAIFPSPVEGEISARAWRLLRLKTVPTSDAERNAAKEQKLIVGVKIVDGPFQLGRPFPLMLESVNKESISSYKDLSIALDHIEKEQPAKVALDVIDAKFKVRFKLMVDVQSQASRDRQRPELNAENAKSAEGAEKNDGDDVDSRRYMIVYPLDDNEADIKSWLKAIELASEVRLTTLDGKDAAVVIGTREEHERVSGLLQSKRPEGSNSGFPTLEEQRAADLAYKLLGVELEKLSPAELERVKAKGYKGGLRVATKEGGPFIWGDLLVGLHVWPTESLKQVTEILSRDDIDQLSPLKYYVLTGGPVVDGQVTDAVHTGRIEVNLEAWRAMREVNAADPVLKIFDTILVVAYDEKEMIRTGEEVDLINDVYHINEDGTVNFGPTYGKVHVAGKTFGEAGKIIQKHLSAKIANCAVKVSPEPQSPSFKAPPKYISTPAYPGPAPNPFSGDQSTLLYDGKTFDEWRQAWRQDLSPEYRIQAVRAFVAFANASEGQQAQEAVHQILQIAEQYDWSSIGRNQLIQPLQEACTAVFDEEQIPSQLAIGAIISFPNAAKNKKFLSFFEYILPRLAQSYPEGNKALRYALPDMNIPKYVGRGGGFSGGSTMAPHSASESRHSESPAHLPELEITIAPFNGIPIAGSRSTYQFIVENSSTTQVEIVELSVTFPPEIVPDMASVKAPDQAALVGNEVRFPPIAALRPSERVSFQITADVLKAGDGEIVAKIKGKDSPEKEVRQVVSVVGK